jgi:hypothetical protein
MPNLADNGNQGSVKLTDVAGSIIDQYIVELGKQDDYKEIAPRLKQALSQKGPSNEAAIRTALFGVENP